jgi:hypothetical protein
MQLDWTLVGTAVASMGGWEVIRRTLKQFFGAAIEAMPPLSDKATWGQRWLYAALKSIATPGKVAEVLAANPPQP